MFEKYRKAEATTLSLKPLYINLAALRYLDIYVNHFKMTESQIKDVFNEMLTVDGITNGEAWDAMCFVKYELERKPDLDLRAVLRNTIVMAGIAATFPKF